MSTKIVKKTLSEETTRARTPKGKWIEHSDPADQVEIDQAPPGDQDQLPQKKSHVAYKFCNYVANSLRKSPTIKCVTLQLGDCVNVVLRRIRSSSAWQWMAMGQLLEDVLLRFCFIQNTAHRMILRMPPSVRGCANSRLERSTRQTLSVPNCRVCRGESSGAT